MSNLKEIFSQIDSSTNDTVEKLLELANTNSHSYNNSGLIFARDFISQELKKLELKCPGLKLQIEKVDFGETEIINERGETEKITLSPGLKVSKTNANAAAKKILLMGHLDTVYPASSLFQSCNFIDSNTLNGPGVADLKGGLLVICKSLEYFEQLPEATNISWQVFLNTDEEIGSPGSSKYFAQLAKDNDLALIFEPSLSDGSIAYRRKGTGNFQFVLKGKSAHVGRNFTEGINAIVIAAELSQKLHELNNKNSNLIVNVGKISGGGALNAVPDLCILGVNIRITEIEDTKFAETELKNLVKELEKKYPGSEIKLHGSFNRKPKIPNQETDELLALIKACAKELNIDLPLRDTGGCCDGNNLHEQGLTNIDTLGVRGGKIHSPEEFVLIDSIPERIKLAVLILQKLTH